MMDDMVEEPFLFTATLKTTTTTTIIPTITTTLYAMPLFYGTLESRPTTTSTSTVRRMGADAVLHPAPVPTIAITRVDCLSSDHQYP